MITGRTLCVGLSKVGSEDQNIVACTLQQMSELNLGKPLHSLIVAANVLHPLESEYLEQFKMCE